MNNDFFTIFIFPFKYERGDGASLEPDDVAKDLHGGNENTESGWAVKKYQLDSINNYNEFFYFHPFVQKSIFNKEVNRGMEFLKRDDYKKLEVEYYYDKDKNKKTNPITTKVNEINVHLFENHIGLLTITTEKQEEVTYEDFLKYNDLVRRAYPPHLGNINDCGLKEDAEKKGEIKNRQFINSLKCETTCKPKYETRLLPVRISLLKDGSEPISEYFKSINLEENKEKDIVSLSDVIKKLLAPFILKEKHDMDMGKREIYYTPYIDDRMFIVSYYADKGLSDKLKQRCCDGYVYETSDEWYRFIFVDGGSIGIKNNDMKKELIRKHTYTRWADYGTLFGMSRYSFVLLCDDSNFSRNVLKQHMKSMYYQLALIVLFQRAMLLKFAEDIDDLTEDFVAGKPSAKLKDNSDILRGDFIRFINKYWFIEVTPQEQGIEIYNQWMGLLNLEKLYNEVQREVSELAEYVENKIEAETNNKLAMITLVGFPLAILGLILMVWQPKPSVMKLCIACFIGVFLVILVMFWSTFSKLGRCKMISWLKDKVSQGCSHKGQ